MFGDFEQIRKELEALLGDRIKLGEAIRAQHAGEEGHHKGDIPDCVVFPRSTEEVSQILALCNGHKVPVIPHGAGTSLEGHLSAPFGGVSVDMSEMNRILDVSAEDLLCTVEAGVTREDLNLHLRDQGLFFPIDPGANATLGGMASTRASGTNAVRYGTMRDNVLSLKAVMADGTVIETGTRARKSAAGYDLTGFLVGSEGTLALVTEVTLRLHGLPEHTAAAVCAFDDLEGAVQTVIALTQMGVEVARVELLDERQITVCNTFSKLDLAEKPTLFFEFHGSEQSVTADAEMVADLAGEFGGADFEWASQPEDRSRLWKARHDAYFAAKASRPGCVVWTTDVCVPISRLADAVLEVRADIDRSGLPATIVGHVGDGNFHVLFLLDPDNGQEFEQASAINDRMVERARAVGGTCTGEHGIGLGKQEALEKERGPEAIHLMRATKQAWDPAGIMNPGKIFPSFNALPRF
jgi:D-lactate dehydrogenase (cytochrome)